MRSDLRRADERWEVTRAAAAWLAAGAIDASAAAVIRERHPDDRRRARPAFRLLFFLLTLFAGQGIWGFGALTVGVGFAGDAADGHAVLLWLLAAAAAGAARYSIHALRLRGFGVEEGLAALAIGFEATALLLSLDQLGLSERTVAAAIGWNLALLGLAVAWRWGLPASGALAAGALFFALALTPWARALWLLAALALLPAARALGRSGWAAPAHRARADEVFAVAAVALYLGAHRADGVARAFALVADRSARGAELTGLPLAGAWLAMVALPAALIVRGWRRRDRLELALGALGALATGASAVHALALRPAWAVLLGAATLLGALAFLLRARFGRSPERVFAGFTDGPLYEADGRRSWLEIAATLAALSPEARRAEAPRGFEGGGGEFGGGGATSEL